MSEIKKYRFSDLYEISSGISSTKEQAGHGYPFLSFSCVFNNYFIPDTLSELMNTSSKEQETYSILNGDIFLTRTSEVIDELGMSTVAIKNYPNATFSGFLKRLRPIKSKVTYPKYMAFYLRSPLFRKTMTNNAVMTLRASLNEAIFSYLELLLPEYDEQVKVGDLLFLLNKKIELNSRINAELETMAKTLYDYWFEQFDFPDANGKPYKTSGGKMVYNPTLKREIPEGWGDMLIEDCSDLFRGVTYGKDDVSPNNKSGIGVLRATNITGNQLDMDELVYVAEDLVSKNQILKKFETLIVMSSGSTEHIGKNGIYYFDVKCAFGAFCSKLEILKEYTFYLSTFLNTVWFKTYIKNQCLGTNINNLTNEHIKKCALVKPDSTTLKNFDTQAKPLYEKLAVNCQENVQLKKLRDWLLPMLMNGQISVKD